MKNIKQVPLMLSIPIDYRDQLRIMAAEQNLRDPSKVTTASTIAKEMVCHVLECMKEEHHGTSKR